MIQQPTIAELIVPRDYEVSQLPDHLKHLECYFLIQRQHVLIDRNAAASTISVFCREDGELFCSCPEAQDQDTCKHEQALNNGLWAHLALLPRCYAVLTCTEDWCRPRSPYVLSLAAQPQNSALEAMGR